MLTKMSMSAASKLLSSPQAQGLTSGAIGEMGIMISIYVIIHTIENY